MDPKEQVFLALCGEPLKKAQIAKKVGKTSGRDVNKYLYELKGEGRAEMVGENPPLWRRAGKFPSGAVQNKSRSVPPKTNILLETPIRDISYGFQEAANLLLIGQTDSTNWKAFAGKIGYTVLEVAVFDGKDESPWAVIKDWQTKKEATFGRFIEIMAQMERADVLTKLKEKLNLAPEAREVLDEMLKPVNGEHDGIPGN